MGDNQQVYTPEFKASLVLEVLKKDKTASSLAAAHDVHPVTLSRWKTEFERKAPLIFSDDTDLDRCRDQLADARDQLDEQTATVELLQGILSHKLDTDEKVELVNRYRDDLGLNRSCEVLDLPKSTYYYRTNETEENCEAE